MNLYRDRTNWPVFVGTLIVSLILLALAVHAPAVIAWAVAILSAVVAIASVKRRIILRVESESYEPAGRPRR